MESVITTFNTTVTETTSQILGKHFQKKKKTWVTAEILDLCNKRRDLRKKRLEPEGSQKYGEVNLSIKRCMKKAKENWIGEQCSEIEDNLRKNNSKRAYQPVKDLTTVKQRKASTIHDYSGNAAKQNEIFSTDGHNIALNCTITRPIEIHQY